MEVFDKKLWLILPLSQLELAYQWCRKSVLKLFHIQNCSFFNQVWNDQCWDMRFWSYRKATLYAHWVWLCTYTLCVINPVIHTESSECLSAKWSVPTLAQRKIQMLKDTKDKQTEWGTEPNFQSENCQQRGWQVGSQHKKLCTSMSTHWMCC